MSKPAAKAAAKSTSGPSYESMIKEAILAHPEEARFGLSRQTIKKVVHSKFPATAKLSEAAFNKHISSAIAKGAEKKTFTLPKGPSGKVKLSAPAKKVTAKKPAAKKPAAKKPAAKKPAAKKPAAKKAAAPASAPATAKKPAAAKKTKSSTAVKAKKPVAKKTAPKKAAAPKKKAAAPKKA